MKFLLLVIVTFMIVMPSLAVIPVCEGENEEVPSCAPCVLTCADRRLNASCPDICKFDAKCYCKQGFYRKNGTCVSEAECLKPEAYRLCTSANAQIRRRTRCY